jgi:PilZ domain
MIHAKAQSSWAQKPHAALQRPRAERRASQRVTLVATAQVVDMSTGTHLSGRISDLSLEGCYIDVMTPFGAGAQVRLRIRYNSQAVELDANVRFSHAALGMGVAFNALSPAQTEMISSWIGLLNADRVAPAQLPRLQAEEPVSVGQVAHSDRKPLAALVRLLVHKGILTAAEASDLVKL